ncbi:MAG: DNA-3-methyladenine glycosylase 2 family protein [Aestuariivita sp.]|nr:DNA-3-methyladenine glycosylase 2 family protein [Aestuariivita sp.]MCY4201505.1 DNA-3-methyladenine glycosylase 2 family protein [Aestuariivita sp.]MCY4287748.1 DNA-3-methyladenine glycosylase 2 family protein [Aestuariivita sp.]MCY4347038.1 DNA-3-methyladenine glycosylase 2 family protein [Aestuariivita sp.]
MDNSIIDNHADLEKATASLAQEHPALARALEQVGALSLRKRPDGFASLLGVIVSQQLSVAAADATWSRLSSAGLTEPERIQVATDEEMRTLGLSRQKIRYARALATSGIDYLALRKKSNSDVIATLIQVPGIGTWTAEIYAIFSLGRADVFASGDLALQEATRILLDLPQRPNSRKMVEISQRWSPWRAVAARILWGYYRECKQREGIRT